jgi:hypothetical protein
MPAESDSSANSIAVASSIWHRPAIHLAGRPSDSARHCQVLKINQGDGSWCGRCQEPLDLKTTKIKHCGVPPSPRAYATICHLKIRRYALCVLFVAFVLLQLDLAKAQFSIDPILSQTPVESAFVFSTKFEKFGAIAVVSGTATLSLAPIQQITVALLHEINKRLGCSKSNDLEVTLTKLSFSPAVPFNTEPGISLGGSLHLKQCNGLYEGDIDVRAPVSFDLKNAKVPQLTAGAPSVVPRGVYALHVLPVSDETVIKKANKAASPLVAKYLHKVNGWIRALTSRSAGLLQLRELNLTAQSAQISLSGNNLSLIVKYSGQVPISKLDAVLSRL